MFVRVCGEATAEVRGQMDGWVLAQLVRWHDFAFAIGLFSPPESLIKLTELHRFMEVHPSMKVNATTVAYFPGGNSLSV